MLSGGLKMKKTTLRMKILSVMLCTGLILSSTSLTFAEVTKNGNANEKIVSSMDFKASVNKQKIKEARRAEMKVTLIVVIKESVSSKIITQAEGDKVLEYVNAKFEKRSGGHKKEKCDGAKGGLFQDLVTDGILTQHKSDALSEKMYIKKTEIKIAETKKGLNILVVNKVLTIQQSSKVEKAIMAKHAERKEIYKKMKGMSEKDRKEYMKKIKSTKTDTMKVLIDNGTLTKEQVIEIQKVLPQLVAMVINSHHGNI